ncbi:MAG: BatA domain-containing protein, partial [bacterium]
MLNPLMLLGLLGLGVPVLIHLINRRRMKPRPLATIQFLDEQDVANAFAPVPRDLLQLLLRLLLLTLFILLMARLTGPSATVGPRAVALVLDNSMSMRKLGPDGKSLFESHRQRILQLVRGMHQGDYFSFTLVGDKVFESTGFTGDRALLERAVTNAWVSDGSGRSVYATIEDSLKELRSKRAPNAALLVFSDQQLRNYPAHAAAAGLAPLLRGSRIKPVFVMDPLTNAPNVEL